MRRRKKKVGGGRENKVFSFFLLIPLVILAGILIYSNWKIIAKRNVLREKKEELTERLGKLEAEKEKLEHGLSESDKKEYWEERIRNQGYKLPEEEVVVVKRKEEEKNGDSPVTPQGKTFWQDFLAEMQSIF